MTDKLDPVFSEYPELGMKKPLLPHQPLGRKILSPKLLSPLGNKSLTKTYTKDKINSADTNDKTKNTPVKQHQNQPAISQPEINLNLRQDTSLHPENTAHIANFSPPNIQKSAVANLPDSWSNLADLIDNFSQNENSKNVVIQPQVESKTWEKIEPSKLLRSPNQSLNISHNSKSTNAIELFPKNNHQQLIQKFTNNSDFNQTEIGNNHENQQNNHHNLTKEETENLELLAQEIYKLLRHRLEIEKERRGNNYSGRLPW